MIPGYSAVKKTMTAQEYYEGVVAGRIKDPTLSMQINVGFSRGGCWQTILQIRFVTTTASCS